MSNNGAQSFCLRKLQSGCALALLLLIPFSARGGGVTLITHGFSGNVNGWISGMAGALARFPHFPGTNYTTYTITLTTDGTNYFYQWSRTNSSPSLTDSGEIIVKLDWSQMAGGGGSGSYNLSTYAVANIASFVLLQTNAIADLGGHALAEFPLHLIGHSRGGSLVSELSRRLGTNGVWVDHLTTLDPHPVNNDGNSEPFFPTDASASNTYANVLFCDDCWQHLGDGLFTPNGESVAGAYVRQLTNLNGGYSSSHSDAHLWYHGTIDWNTPASDTEATITSSERQNWWINSEQRGTNTGFLYSLIGGGNRLSFEQPLGPGTRAIRDGYNQMWDLGAGTASNRVALATNNGSWPSLIKFNRTDTNKIAYGQALGMKLYYQWARPAASNAVVSFYLDDDQNPLNSNGKLIGQLTVPGASNGVNSATTAFAFNLTNATPGMHMLLGVMNAGGRTRYLYAPESVQVTASEQPPTLDITELTTSQFRLEVHGQAGQTLVLQAAPDLVNWQSIATNTLSSNTWFLTNSQPSAVSRLFYRARLNN
jgi:hypothetical protein